MSAGPIKPESRAKPDDTVALQFTRKQLDLLSTVMRIYQDQALAAGYEQSVRDSIEIRGVLARGYAKMRLRQPGGVEANRKRKKRARAARNANLAELSTVIDNLAQGGRTL